MRYFAGEFIEILVRDSTGRKIERHKFPVADAKLGSRILCDLADRYGIRIIRKGHDLDWI